MPRPRIRKRVTVVTAKDLGHVLGSAADTAEMEFRSELTVALAKIIQAGRLTHARPYIYRNIPAVTPPSY